MHKDLMIFTLPYLLVATLPWVLGVVEVKESMLLFRLVLDSVVFFVFLYCVIHFFKNRGCQK